MRTSKGYRQHGIAALLASLQVLKELLIPFMVLIVSHGFRSDGGGRALLVRLAIGGALLVGAFLWGYLRWWFLRYRVEDGELKVDEGVVMKKHQSIPIERIQTVDFSEGILHRIFGLVRVQIQTAGGIKPEAVLTAVSRAEADRLERLLKPGPSGGDTERQIRAVEDAPLGVSAPDWPQTERSSEAPLRAYKLPAGRLFLAGLTANNMGVAISILFAVLSQADDLLPNFEIIDFLAESSGSRAFLLLAASALGLAWIMAVGSSILRFADFTLVKQGEDLLITRGLLERRKVTLPVRRIQAVRIVQEVLWKPFGLVAVHVVCAGYGSRKGESSLLFPLMPIGEVELFLREICPDCAVHPEQVPFRRVEPGAKWGYLLPVPIVFGILTALVLWFSPWGWLGLPVTTAALLMAEGAYRRAGWHQDERQLIIRKRWLTETVAVIPRRRIQYFTLSQNPLQRRNGLSSFRVSMAASTIYGTHFSLKGLRRESSMALLVWSGRRSDPIKTHSSEALPPL